MPFNEFLNLVKTNQQFSSSFIHHESLPAKPAEFKFPSDPLPDELTSGLLQLGLRKLYSHQVDALERVREGKNVVAVTPTASGKSLLYTLPVLENLNDRSGGHALLIFPLKALEQDQAGKMNRIIQACGWEECIKVGIYDGDTPSSKRAAMRKAPPNILITNPDMLHLSIMSYHPSWEELLRGLRFIILDELHIYRGVFGSNILHLIRRLLRLCRYYGSNPQFITTSATIAGAGELVENLTGQKFDLIEDSGAPLNERHFLFFNPLESYLTFALRLFGAALREGLKVIAFTNARRTTELMHMWLNEMHPKMAGRVSSYRAGFLPGERREIEQKLLRGDLNGVISTSALELGIDIGGLDICILVGYPGTIATTWQRAGRVGREDRPNAICLVAGQDQLDQYFMRHPEDFFARPVEKAIVDPLNEHIAAPHILSAAQEIPISKPYPLWNSKFYRPLIEKLASKGQLLQGASGDRWFSSRRRPQRFVDIRSSGDKYTIETESGNESLGSISGRSVFSECHPGSVYLHHGRLYFVKALDQEAKRISVTDFKGDFYTTPLFEKETEILDEIGKKQLPAGKVDLVKLKVTEQLVGYQKRRFVTQELLSQHELDYPPSSFETIGLALAIPDQAARESARKGLHFRGGIHGVEHALLALAPMFAICDRRDMGGYSQVAHPQIEGPAVFMYDGHPGGIGLSARLFEIFPELVERTLRLVEDCPCETGCPSCIHSPKCGHGNIPLDKASTILSLEIISGSHPAEHDDTQQILEAVNLDIKQPGAIREKTEDKSDRLSPKVPLRWPKDKSGLVFDLETQRSAEEVGGWGNIRSMGLAWAVIYRFPQDEWLDFEEKDVDNLIRILGDSDLVVGFNQIRFDYEVLRGYSGFNFQKLKSYDILVEIHQALRHRLKLDSVASATLGVSKSADGLQSLEWWKAGDKERVAKYCRQDVEITRDLFYHILDKEYLLFEKRGIGLVRIPLRFDY